MFYTRILSNTETIKLFHIHLRAKKKCNLHGVIIIKINYFSILKPQPTFTFPLHFQKGGL